MQLKKKDLRRVVIYYHSVKKEGVKQFEKQMAYLAKNYTVVKASHIKTVPVYSKKTIVVITFDDAFVSILENALPALKKWGLPANIFVPTGNLGKPPQWEILNCCLDDKDETIINKQQIANLKNDRFEISSHTVSHPVLTEIDNDRLYYEITNSKMDLERMVGCSVLAISYPYGAYDTRVCEAAKRAGYELGFTNEPCIFNNFTDNFQIGRFAVSTNDSLVKFKLKVSGAYQVTKYLRAMKRRLMHNWQSRSNLR
jgi:peptidoglycan/xylan/chitin deacetylase (PgdA/CDA1 family)